MVLQTGGGRFEQLAANTTTPSATSRNCKLRTEIKNPLKSVVAILENMKRAQACNDPARVIALFGQIQPFFQDANIKGTTEELTYRTRAIKCRDWARRANKEKQRKRKREMQGPGRS